MARARKKKKADPKKAASAESLAALDDSFPGGLPDAKPAPPENLYRYIDAAGKIDGWAPAGEVLDLIESVRTVFPDFNRAVRVGGLPDRKSVV